MKLLVLLCVFVGLPALAKCNLTIDSYIEIELETRELTVQGMETRLTLLEIESDIETINEEDLRTYNQIQKVYNRYHCTPTEHLVYGAEYEGDVALYFVMHPEPQAKMNQIEDRFEYVSQQIRRLTEHLPTPVEEVL